MQDRKDRQSWNHQSSTVISLAYVSYIEKLREESHRGIENRGTYAGDLTLEHHLHDDLTSRGDSVLLVTLDVAARRVKKLGSFRHGHTHNLLTIVSFVFKAQAQFERREEGARLGVREQGGNIPLIACHRRLACYQK